MEIHTTRFGPVDIHPNDVILFPSGILGLDDCQHWVLLADAQNEALGWLQSTTHGDVALAVVSPKRFVPDHHVRVAPQELAPLALGGAEDTCVLAIVGRNDQSVTLNLKAPLVINLRRRLGRQVIDNADQPLQYEVTRQEEPRRKIA
jgi:flagellar assembly factor FliW